MASGYKDELNRIARGAGIIFGGRLASVALQYLFVIVVSRGLGAASAGIFFLGFAIIGLAAVVGQMGLHSGVLRYVALYNGIGDGARVKGTIFTALRLAAGASIFIGLVLFLKADFVSQSIFNKAGLLPVLRLFCMALPFLALMIVLIHCIQGFQQMKYVVYVRDLLQPLICLLGASVFISLGFSVRGVVLSYIISVALGLALAFFFLKVVFLKPIGAVNPTGETKKLLSYSFPLLLVTLLIFITQWVNILMVGYFRPAQDVGVFNAAARTAICLGIILVSFNTIFAPMISDLYNRGEMERLAMLFKTVTRWVFVLSAPGFLLVVLLAKEILAIFGTDFIAGWASLIILAGGQMVNASSGAVGYMLIMTGRQNVELFNSLGAATVNFILCYLLIPPYGIVGAAVATATTVVLLNLVRLMQVYALLGFHPYSVKFLKPFFSCIGAGIIIMLFKALGQGLSLGPLSLLAILVIVFMSIYFFFLRIMGLDEEDRIILQVVRSKIKGARQEGTGVEK